MFYHKHVYTPCCKTQNGRNLQFPENVKICEIKQSLIWYDFVAEISCRLKKLLRKNATSYISYDILFMFACLISP